MHIHLKFRLPFGVVAVTIFPWIFISASFGELCGRDQKAILIHEGVHINQQKRWAIYGLGIGLLVWWFLYVFCLPVWKNPWRKKWESEAFAIGDGMTHDEITTALRDPPYWLF